MVYENGTYYLYSMYCKENSDRFCNIWLARSADGVHFEDYGCVVEDFPDLIWAMKVYRGKDAFYMNSGSFTADGRQGVLKFWKSADLLHWEYQPDLDVTAPDAEREGTRLDCMNVVEQNGKYYGYATGQNSFLTSDDGAHFITNPAQINCDPFPPYNTAFSLTEPFTFFAAASVIWECRGTAFTYTKAKRLADHLPQICPIIASTAQAAAG